MTDLIYPDYLSPIKDYIDQTHLVAFDGCHKIYMALDEKEANWFRQEYPFIVQGHKDEMLKAVINWYNDSCSLKFVCGVRHNAADPNQGFVDIVPQGAEDDEADECWLCGSPWCYDEDCQDEEE